MSHLTRTTQKSLFVTEVAPRPTPRAEPVGFPFVLAADTEPRDAQLAVRPDMTPRESAQTRMSNYPRYDLPSVENLPNRMRGKHY